MVESYAFIHSANLCLLIGDFNLLTFKVVTDKDEILTLFCYLFSVCLIPFFYSLFSALLSFVFDFLYEIFEFFSHFLFCIFCTCLCVCVITVGITSNILKLQH